MASERCAKCDATMGTEHRYGCPSATAPAPREAGAILTRDAFESLVGDWTLGAPGGIRTAEMVLPIQNRLKQHDAALRAEVERLKEELNDTNDLLESEYDSAARIRKEELECTDPDCERTKVEGPSHWWGDFGCTKGREQEKARADAAEAEVERLRTGHPWDEAEQKVRADLIAERDAAYMLVIEAGRERKAAEAERDRLRKLLSLDPNGAELARIYDGWTDALAERDRLAEALREIAESCCYLDTDYKAIAAAALKREERKTT